MGMDSESLNQMIGLIIRGSIILTVVLFVLTIVLVVWPFWRIFSKAGLQGALSLLMLVPIVNMFVPLYLAFADWPALKAQQKQG